MRPDSILSPLSYTLSLFLLPPMSPLCAVVTVCGIVQRASLCGRAESQFHYVCVCVCMCAPLVVLACSFLCASVSRTCTHTHTHTQTHADTHTTRSSSRQCASFFSSSSADQSNVPQPASGALRADVLISSVPATTSVPATATVPAPVVLGRRNAAQAAQEQKVAPSKALLGAGAGRVARHRAGCAAARGSAARCRDAARPQQRPRPQPHPRPWSRWRWRWRRRARRRARRGGS